MGPIRTPLCDLFGIEHPIVLAGMNVAGPELAAAVTNAGGLGVMGGVGYTPKMLRQHIEELKSLLINKKAPFGIDLLIPQVGGNARKTNHDYTEGHLPELADIIIESGAKLFVCAVGVPPRWLVDKMHANGILVQNMCGAPKHAVKALEAGADIICAQGGEGGGHTGEIATMVLIPQVVDIVRGRISPMTGKQVMVIAAGGIFDGRGLAAALSLGAVGVWVGTRFVASEEAKAGPRHVNALLKADSSDTIRTTIYTGRPMRVYKDDVNNEWETYRKVEMLQLQGEGIIPFQHDLETGKIKNLAERLPLLMGQASGAVKEVLPAKKIVDNIIAEAAITLQRTSGFFAGSKL